MPYASKYLLLPEHNHYTGVLRAPPPTFFLASKHHSPPMGGTYRARDIIKEICRYVFENQVRDTCTSRTGRRTFIIIFAYHYAAGRRKADR